MYYLNTTYYMNTKVLSEHNVLSEHDVLSEHESICSKFVFLLLKRNSYKKCNTEFLLL